MIKALKILNLSLVCLFSVVLTINAFSNSRHRFHTSLTRIDFNADQKLFEVSIKLFTHDLIPVLEKKTRRPVDLEKTANVDQIILNYLNENFVLKDKKGEPKTFKWVGKEMETDVVWIYLEAPATESAEGYSLQNTIFFESFREQTNFVICRFIDRKSDLVFKVGDRVKEIGVNKITEKN